MILIDVEIKSYHVGIPFFFPVGEFVKSHDRIMRLIEAEKNDDLKRFSS